MKVLNSSFESSIGTLKDFLSTETLETNEHILSIGYMDKMVISCRCMRSDYV